MSETTVSKDEENNRYELHLGDDRIGFIDYRREGEVIELHHTEVDPEHGGNGHAATLADFALRDISEGGLMVKPSCPYIAKHIENNPEFGSLVAGGDPAQD
ncbi:MAG: GNAT family N-acetyltransferase [Arachnia sp.]